MMNYVDDQYIIDVLPELARESENHEIDINFSNGQISPKANYPEVLFKSIAYWNEWLPKHIANHGLEMKRISNINFSFRLLKINYEITVSATDDRGKEHKVFVNA
jgi:hypothetical protein